MNKLTYNYYCLNKECKTNHIQLITKEVSEENREENCKACNSPMKQVGISTRIVHKGTQESFSKMNR